MFSWTLICKLAHSWRGERMIQCSPVSCKGKGVSETGVRVAMPWNDGEVRSSRKSLAVNYPLQDRAETQIEEPGI